MPDPYEGITEPNPERVRLCQSWFRPSPLEAVAEAISVASEKHGRFYVERFGDLWRWRLSHPGGAYPLLRVTARFLQVDYCSLILPFKTVVGDAVLGLDEVREPDASAVLVFSDPVTPEAIARRVLEEVTPAVGRAPER